MFTEAITAAVESAHRSQVDALSRQLWQAHAAGHIPDEAAQSLAETLQRRREEGRELTRSMPATHGRPPLLIPRPKPQRSPDRARSIARRRLLAASGPMPPALAANFTTGELAALRIIADEFRGQGSCSRSIAEIAARAGIGMSTVRNAVRFAARCGLLTVQYRPRPGRKSLTNVVRIISREWLAWIKRGSGFKKPEATDTDLLNRRANPGHFARGRTGQELSKGKIASSGP